MTGAGDSEQRILDGRAWSDFCDALKRAGDVVLREATPRDAFDRAEGFRYLSRLTRVALESCIEFADPLFPVLRRPAHETVKIGADNPDNYYQSAALSRRARLPRPRHARQRALPRLRHLRGRLRLHGAPRPDRLSRRAASCSIAAGRPLRDDPVLARAAGQLAAHGARHFVCSSCARPSRIAKRERIAELSTRAHRRRGGPQPITPAFVDRGLQAAAAYVAGTAALFADWAEGFAKRKNELPRFDPAIAAAAHGDPNILYFHGYWELADDEALVIEVTPPACDYWNFQLNNHWMESLDYRYHTIALNHSQVRSAARTARCGSWWPTRDPGVPNWIETAGHRRGTMCLRWVGAQRAPGADDPGGARSAT